MLEDRLRNLVIHIGDDYVVRKLTWMKSMPGCPIQEENKDYVIDDVNNSSNIPYSCTISIMEGTKLRVYSKCFDCCDKDKLKDIEIPIGHCLIMRGDLIHCGLSYDKYCYRIHVYITVANMPWTTNTSQSLVTLKFPCKFCANKFKKRQQRINHQQRCKENPKYQEYLKRYKQRDQIETVCEICNKTYKSRSEYRSHNKRKHT